MINAEFEVLGNSLNGLSVLYHPTRSHTATHFNSAPHLKEVVISLLPTLELLDDVVGLDLDMDKVVGESDVVETDGLDEIVFAMRTQREDQGYVPFTKSRTSQPTNYVSIFLVRLNEDTYELSSAWFGRFESPMFPQMDNATEESIPYWSRHAFVWGSQEIIPGTERSDCPW